LNDLPNTPARPTPNRQALNWFKPTSIKEQYERLLSERNSTIAANQAAGKVELVPLQEELQRLLDDLIAHPSNAPITGTAPTNLGQHKRGVSTQPALPKVRINNPKPLTLCQSVPFSILTGSFRYAKPKYPT
jgi:hypothetical protein